MNDRPIHILVTGFGPFPHVPVNPAEQIARLIAADQRFGRMGFRVTAHIFPTRWSILAGDVEDVIAAMKPDAVLHLGVAARRKMISIETMARLGSRRLLPDAAGLQEAHVTIQNRPGLPLRIAASAIPLQAVIMRAGAKVKLSNNAGRYLCNGLYAQSLWLRRQNNEQRPTLFIHIPMPAKAGGTVPVHRARSYRITAKHMARALGAALPLLAGSVRRQRTIKP